MTYTQRIALSQDSSLIAPFVAELCQEWATIDPARKIKPNFDWERYATYLLNQPQTYCILLEHHPTPEQTEIVGGIITNAFDESPTPNATPDELEHHEIAHPFQPQRIGTVMGFYIQPKHRQAKNVIRLIEAAINQADELKLDTIDVQVFENRTGIQAFLKRRGFQAVNTQYIQARTVPTRTNLPNLHRSANDLKIPDYQPKPTPIPLRDPQTGEQILNPHNQPVFITPLTDTNGQLLLSSQHIPIYPPPVRDPEHNAWIFDKNGQLVVCPPLYDDNGKIVERDGLPQFRSPTYNIANGEASLIQEIDGSYQFQDV